MREEKDIASCPSTRKEIEMGNTIYRVTSVFLGEKDLAASLEQLAIRKAMADIKAGAPRPAK
jgi:hypothetical protein